jgi:signal transduction histidine kinase
LRYFASVIDITELDEARERLERQNLELISASRAKSEFLSSISHELRTPLNAIIGFSEVMESEPYGPLGDAKYREYIGEIRASGKNLLRIVNDILDLTRVESGNVVLREEAFDPATLVDASLGLVEGDAKAGGVTIETSFSMTAVRLRADFRMIRQALVNLLSNAIKFTPQEGTVLVEVRLDDRGNLVIAVRDTGIGIREADLQKVLSPFGQGDGGLDRKYGGVGIGLPLANALIRLHGGAIELASVIGEGTTARLSLPAARVLA